MNKQFNKFLANVVASILLISPVVGLVVILAGAIKVNANLAIIGLSLIVGDLVLLWGIFKVVNVIEVNQRKRSMNNVHNIKD